MAFCQKCGKEVETGVAFCPSCGNNIVAPASSSEPTNTAKKLHCPNCKSYNFTITTESSVNGAVTTGKRIKTTSVSNTHRNYWVCSDCGTKFRNIQSLEEEIKKEKNSPAWCAVFTVLALAYFVYTLVAMASNPMAKYMLMYPRFISFIIAIVCFIFIFVYKKKLKKLKEELEYLKVNCFN